MSAKDILKIVFEESNFEIPSRPKKGPFTLLCEKCGNEITKVFVVDHTYQCKECVDALVIRKRLTEPGWE